MFDESEVIYEYSEEQAIEDGVLCHPYAERWPWLLVSGGIVEAVHREMRESERTWDQCLIPLLIDVILHVQSLQRKGAIDPDGGIIGTLDNTLAGSVWIATNSKGGLTVLLPSEY